LRTVLLVLPAELFPLLFAEGFDYDGNGSFRNAKEENMKFVRYQAGSQVNYGIWEGDFVQEISGPIFGKPQFTGRKHKLLEVRLLAPVEPSKILCVGLNYRDHIEELKREVPRVPSHFLKPLTAVIGPGDPILYPRVATRVDYEGELAVVIKDRIKDVSESEALKHVFGYTCLNDMTERDLTKVEGQLTRAKGFDTFCPFGPCVATGLDPFKLKVKTYLNGKLVQEDSTANMVFSVPYLVSYLSQCMTLFPGDLISTGTPKGIGPMKPGDVVEVSVDGIGTLRNTLKSM
jgi:2-keto-4-pentenoate hydratase/2-oxohepta-3-ene-1,7-dioic acid hydratase in catechol pathway